MRENRESARVFVWRVENTRELVTFIGCELKFISRHAANASIVPRNRILQ